MTLVRLDDDMRAVVASERLCFAATVTPEGRPHLSPKSTIRVWDDHHLFFCDIASPGTCDNRRTNDWIALNVVEARSRRGYRFLGRATGHREDDVYRTATGQVFAEERTTYPVHAVVLVAVVRALPIVSPGYDHMTDERETRRHWRERRAQFDAEFEDHIRGRGSWQR